MERIIGWFRKIQNPIMGPGRSESVSHFQELPSKQETKTDKITLTLIEETPSGPYWDVRVEGDKDFTLSSDELVLNMGHKRPAIKFTSEGMTTICPKCSGVVRYGAQFNVLNWWCDACEHHKITKVSDIAQNLAYK